MKMLKMIISDIFIFAFLVGVICLIITIPLYIFSIPLNGFIEACRWGMSIYVVTYLIKKGYIKINPSF